MVALVALTTFLAGAGALAEALAVAFGAGFGVGFGGAVEAVVSGKRFSCAGGRPPERGLDALVRTPGRGVGGGVGMLIATV